MTIYVETEGMERDARAALDSWVGARSTWALLNKYNGIQCVNLGRGNVCDANNSLSVAGTGVDLRLTNPPNVRGRFELGPSGALVGTIVEPASETVYPARIELR